MFTLSIHDGHNSSVALFKNEKLVYAIQEERLSRIKNHWGAPNRSIDLIIKKFNLNLANLDLILFSGYQYTDRLHTTREEYISYTRKMLLKRPLPFVSKLNYFNNKISKKVFSYADQENRIMFYTQDLVRDLYKKYKCKFIEHHNCHVFTGLAGYSNTEYDSGVIITLDGFGDGLCGSIFSIDKLLNLQQISSFDQNVSFAKVYAWTTTFLGFTHLEHEYKLMGMSPYADSRYIRELADKLHDMFKVSDASIIPCKCIGGKYTNDYKLFSYLRKIYEFQRFDVICGALQLWLEEIVRSLVKNVVKSYKPNYIGLSGGLFMNVKLNHILRESLPEETSLFIFPSCGDETNIFGAAFCSFATKSSYHDNTSIPLLDSTKLDAISHIDSMYLGSDSLSLRDEVLNSGCNSEAIYTFQQMKDINSTVCHLLSHGEIVARVSGREEFGARSLGNRSLLCNPSNLLSKEYLNDVIKSRDFWMPFAGSLRIENAPSLLQNYSSSYSPSYMIMTYDSIDSLSYVCCTHPRDKTIRPQTVTLDSNPSYWDLLNKYEGLTGQKVLLNTSLNLHGFPVIHCLDDLVMILKNSGLKYIALDDLLITKK